MARRDNGKGPVALGPSPHDRFVLAIKPYQLKLETCVGGVRAQLFQQCGENVKLIASDVMPESAISLLNQVVLAMNRTTEAMMEARDWVYSYAKRGLMAKAANGESTSESMPRAKSSQIPPAYLGGR